MLYLSTRNKADSFTAYKVLRSANAPDGGMFLPMQLPVQDDIALAAFEQMQFGETVATILNLFYGTKLSGWDVDFAVGRQAFDLASIGAKILAAESWHNPAGSHAYFKQRLYDLVTEKQSQTETPNPWFSVSVDIALLFAAYGKFCHQGIYEFDIAVQTGDLQQLLAIRYAVKMGLPIRRIILGCTEQDGLWDFLSYGDFAASKKERNICFEALLWLEFSYAESTAYCGATEKKITYRLSPARLEQFRSEIFASVVGDRRVVKMVESMIQADSYRLQEDTARAFCALQDYRAKAGESNTTLVISTASPDCWKQEIMQATGITEAAFNKFDR